MQPRFRLTSSQLRLSSFRVALRQDHPVYHPPEIEGAAALRERLQQLSAGELDPDQFDDVDFPAGDADDVDESEEAVGPFWRDPGFGEVEAFAAPTEARNERELQQLLALREQLREILVPGATSARRGGRDEAAPPSGLNEDDCGEGGGDDGCADEEVEDGGRSSPCPPMRRIRDIVPEGVRPRLFVGPSRSGRAGGGGGGGLNEDDETGKAEEEVEGADDLAIEPYDICQVRSVVLDTMRWGAE